MAQEFGMHYHLSYDKYKVLTPLGRGLRHICLRLHMIRTNLLVLIPLPARRGTQSQSPNLLSGENKVNQLKLWNSREKEIVRMTPTLQTLSATSTVKYMGSLGKGTYKGIHQA